MLSSGIARFLVSQILQAIWDANDAMICHNGVRFVTTQYRLSVRLVCVGFMIQSLWHLTSVLFHSPCCPMYFSSELEMLMTQESSLQILQCGFSPILQAGQRRFDVLHDAW